MSYSKPNIFDYVGRKNDERWIHEKFISTLFHEEKYASILLHNISEKVPFLKGCKVVANGIIEQHPFKISSGNIGYADIVVIVTSSSCSKKIPVILELKTYSKASNHQLADYFYEAKEKYQCSPVILYITPDKRSPEVGSLEKKDKNNLKIDKEVFCFSYKELIQGIQDVTEKVSDTLLPFVAKQYSLLVQEPEFCNSNTQIVANRDNYIKLEDFLKHVYSHLKAIKESNNIELISEYINTNGIYPYHKIGLKKQDLALYLEIGYSSKSERQEDTTYFRMLYGFSASNWDNIDFIPLFRHLDSTGKKVFYNTNNKQAYNQKCPDKYKKHFECLTQGSEADHINPQAWLFAQNLNWLVTEVVQIEGHNEKEEQIMDNIAKKVAEFIISDFNLVQISNDLDNNQ